MAEFAGYYTEALLDTDGRLQKEVSYTLYIAGTNEIAEVYSDTLRSDPQTAEDLETNERGIASFFVNPGLYEIEMDTVRTLIPVGLDSDEVTPLIAAIASIQEGTAYMATIAYVDEQVALVNEIDTDEFAKRNEDNNLSGKKIYNVTSQITLQTGTTYAILPSDTGSILRFNSGSAITITLPNSTPANSVITVLQSGSGQITFTAASGATLNHRQSHTKTAGQYALVSVIVTTNSGGSAAAWVLGGDTAA